VLIYYVYFTVPPIFVRSTDLIIENISNDTELVVLPDWNSTTKFCSELQNRDISVACRAVGIPEPRTNIFVNGNISEPFLQTENEVVIISAPLSYGEVMMFECQASTMTSTSTITVNLTYTCKCIIITYTCMFVCTCVLMYKEILTFYCFKKSCVMSM